MLKMFSLAFVPKGGSYTLWWAAEGGGKAQVRNGVLCALR